MTTKKKVAQKKPASQPKPEPKPSARKGAAKPPEKGKAGKRSALAAAAQVLNETKTAMNCTQMIEAMTEKGYWTSPNGKTPASTLYAAIVRHIAIQGDEARFQKTGKGTFAATQKV
jgi:HB1, ASXL, restriction endonuclease HTH domain